MAGDDASPVDPKARRRRRRRVVLLVLALLAAGGGIAYYVDHYLPYWHWRAVEDGQFYRSSQLSGEDLAEAIDDYGIKTIFNLRDVGERAEGDWYATEHRVAREKGVRVIDIPLRAGQPPNESQVRQMLAVLDDPKNRPVLAHCFHGSIRSAAAEGLYRREYLGESGEDAYDRTTKWGRDLQDRYPDIWRFIVEYEPRRKAGAGPDAKGP